MPPLERHALLRPVSREHHEGLLFCWQVRQALAQALVRWHRCGSDRSSITGICFRTSASKRPYFLCSERRTLWWNGRYASTAGHAPVPEHRRPHLRLVTDRCRIGSAYPIRGTGAFQRVQEVASEAQLEWIDRLRADEGRVSAGSGQLPLLHGR